MLVTPEKKARISNMIKYSIPMSVKKILQSPIVVRRTNTIDEQALENMPYGNIILNFANYMIENIDDENLTNFYNNINNLSVNFDTTYSHTSGEYSAVNNTIDLDTKTIEKVDKTLPHELFHLSSTYYDKNNKICYSGFGQFKKGLLIGLGLTEGYTELLTERYINPNLNTNTNTNEDLYKYPYSVETLLSESIEEIVGQEKMTELYFKSDLMSLIKILEKYTSSREIVNFIRKLDYIYSSIFMGNTIPVYETPFFIKTIMDEVLFTKLLAINKMKEDIKIGKITIDEYNDDIDFFIDNIDNNTFITKKNKEMIKAKVLRVK